MRTIDPTGSREREADAASWVRVAYGHHLSRVAISTAVIVAAALTKSAALGFVGGGMLLLAAFTFNHDLMHGALGVSRRARDLGMSLLGALMGMSGHAILVSHLHHHARPLAEDDLEGLAARMSPVRALLLSPWLSLGYRGDIYRVSGARHRRWQLAELAVNAATFAGLVATRHPAALGVAAALALGQLTMPFWAGHVPHRAPSWLVDAAAWLARRTPLRLSAVVSSLAFHETHHRHPRIPTHRLREVCDA